MYYIVPNIRTKSVNSSALKDDFSLKSYLLNVLLAFYSILNLIKLKIQKVHIANYLIDIKNSDHIYDVRSQEILKIIHPENSVNFMHINNLKYTFFSLHKKSNAIYFEAIYYVIKPFLRKKRFTYQKPDNDFVVNLLEIHQEAYNDSYYIHKIMRFILKFLKMKTFIAIDDIRYANELYIAAKELNIVTIGYMHGRFNEYHLTLCEFPFDKYLVWSQYFKDKILNMSEKYKAENIEIVGHFKITSSLPSIKNQPKNILWLGESNIDYEELYQFIEIISMNGYNVYFRGKPGEKNNLSLFLYENKIHIDISNTLFESLISNEIGLVVGTHSTGLMESWLIGVPAIVLKSNFDYGSHLWKDHLLELSNSADDILYFVNTHLNMTQEEINTKKNKIWGQNHAFDQQKVLKIIMGQK